MTENEQLKRNTEIEYAKQRLGELTAYVDELYKNCRERLSWKLRADTMEAFAIVCYMGLVIYCLVANVDPEVMEMGTDWFFLIIFVCMIRAWYHHSRWTRAEGEWDGMIKTLKVLGHNIDDGDKKRTKVKRKSLFSRFKEFFERVGVNEKQYGTT